MPRRTAQVSRHRQPIDVMCWRQKTLSVLAVAEGPAVLMYQPPEGQCLASLRTDHLRPWLKYTSLSCL